MNFGAKLFTALALAVTLGGCLTLDELTGGRYSLVTAAISNPVGTDQQYEIEGAVVIARRAATEYFHLPQCRRTQVATIEKPCARRSIKVAIQSADRRLQIVLVAFRKFVRDNPTVSAASAAKAVWDVLGELRTTISNAEIK